MRSSISTWCFAGLLFCVASSSDARAQNETPWWAGELGVAAGFDWSSGDYEEDADTDLLYVPVSISYRLDDVVWTGATDQLALRLTIPYLRIKSPLRFFEAVPAGSGGSRSEEGLGDLVLAASYTWFPRSKLPAFELTGKVKIPTADEDRNLGTGKADAFLQVDAFKRVGIATLFAGAGYRFVGDPPRGRLHNSPYASGGAAFSLHRRVAVGTYYNFLGSPSGRRHDSHELVGFANLKVSESFSVGPYAVWGVAGYSPDYAVGLSLRFRIPVGRRPH